MVDGKVLVLNAPNNGIDIYAEKFLESLIGKSAMSRFLESCLHHCPVLFQDGHKHPSHTRVDDMKENLFDFDVESLLESSASDSVQVWLLNSLNKNEKKLDSIKVDAKQAYKLYLAGHSLYCRASPELEALLVPKALNDLGLGPGNNHNGNDRFRRGELEMFYARKGHVTNFHCDFQENITIQLTGSKKWIFRGSKLDHPLRGVTPHFQSEDSTNPLAEQQLKTARLCHPSFTKADMPSLDEDREREGEYEVTVCAGDVLYHPAGVWHRVECLDDSISLNISLTASSYADVFCSNLHQLLLKNNRFRQPVSTRHIGDARMTMDSLMKAIPALLNCMKSEFILPAFDFKDESSHKLKNENSERKRKASDNDDEEDEEGEEDGDENESILVYDPSTQSEGYAFAANPSDYGYILNPSAEVLFESDLLALGWKRSPSIQKAVELRAFKGPEDVLMVHSGFGNETFESLHRTVLIIPLEMSSLVMNVLGKADDAFMKPENSKGGNKKRKIVQSQSVVKESLLLSDLLVRSGISYRVRA